MAYLLCLSFVGALTLMVDAAEIGHDHRHRKCYDEYPAEGAHSAHNLPDHRVGNHVTIAVQHAHALVNITESV